MCGIIGYIGRREAAPLLLNGLKRLEYRGYDSAGMAVLNGSMKMLKKKGSVSNLEELLNVSGTVMLGATVGIAHTRWATHGDPSDRNAHPHMNVSGDIALIHNGIIENYSALKQELMGEGYVFESDTDSEVLVHLIDRIWKNDSALGLEGAVRQALRHVEGAYGICVVSSREPDKIVVARKGSPLVIGLGDGEFFIASDAAPIVEHTNKVVYLSDGEMAVVTRDSYTVKTIENVEQQKRVTELDFSLEKIEKGGFEHFMLKEIFEQPEVMRDVMRGRVRVEEGRVHLGGIHDYLDRLKQAKRIMICACGTSWHAGLIGEYLIEEFARIPVEVDYASEFRYRNPIVSSDDVVIVISQSGETADTLAALRLAKEKGAMVMGICNVVGSTIPRETLCGMYTHAGPEVGVASTKAFTAQVIVLFMLAMALSKGRTISQEEIKLNLRELAEVPDKVAWILEQNDAIKEIAVKLKDARNALYLGRGYNFPVALEGALKLKEISYIHAEGYPAAEMKHGPIALIDEDMPVIVIATRDNTYAKILSNIEEVRSRKGRVIAIASEGDREIERLTEDVIYIPQASAAVLPLLTVIPLQLLSYHVATLRGCNVDRPRNLAKSVTVE
ncbi:MAG TPA: glutamine--fructose-6-phosphate aminotransferase [Chlorobaculum sp.]|uniref:Glutamine--fructose-6-phosphate aminotransferase [isomerizing] n=1 Tax=Chlorobaculum tepidum (strain ATCC 49652 / DSM 12025 / NBRC 103806 / TLS) TaxID=194439 RepID=GLMS_CHLTE|nr:glutamine--fructose-6-phosphate transaminase (isomerizing) [Chlorobaculum tepidum]Q8KG38.3 RecName: Full=Glutamine--fructose-6-phosphate aminotransferase [isomerizing]; AltName: Full=D-fructose-6-phosphate amidotransferase; AltName: Full=GFAT; AltName: Full=Glucosamine-6-phosphate synthase; AltName: Full=Hexosephosphate aminotransferase; AltName: Full=L-glutamine--D-fructose-6-phosphate amidotransferase [Chlorobaculum tepidum TLS]AAM71378.1 glucosamine--fructose-6-phosphate aminotransferase [C